ncbi:MAG: hypothetical protein WD851_03090 [Pirellulales bacterium]
MGRRKQRRSVHWAAYLWPGLPHLWIAGSWAGLILALSFTVLLNLVLVTTLVWTDWLPPRVQLACAALLGVIWLAAVIETRFELRRIAASRQQSADCADSGVDGTLEADQAEGIPADELFRQAQAAYLSGDWLAAERTLRDLLRLDRRDIEGQLLLATLWRHSGRLDEAVGQLDRLQRLEDAAPWQFEINREREFIAVARGGEGSGDPLPLTGETSPIAA